MDDGGPGVRYFVICIVLISLDLLLYIIQCIFSWIREKKIAQNAAEDEIISMVNEGHEQGYIEASEAAMITNIFEFGDKKAQDIMTHRSNIVAIDAKMSLKEAVSFMMEANNSRFPVYEESLDHIRGILHLKDALRDLNENPADGRKAVGRLNHVLREAKFIPETRKIDSLFHTMQITKLQMVIVIDEYGQTSGLIAMEDILEEIVGNIMDEYDEEEGYIQQKGVDKYLVDGMTPLAEIEEKFNIRFHEHDFETLNGFLISKMERIPEEKDHFSICIDGYEFKILVVENKMIRQILMTKLGDEQVMQNEAGTIPQKGLKSEEINQE